MIWLFGILVLSAPCVVRANKSSEGGTGSLQVSQEDFQKLIGRVEELEKQNVAQQRKLNQQDGEIQALRSMLLAEKGGNSIGNLLNNVTGNLQQRSRRADNEVLVGFFATLNTQLLHMGKNQDIIFDKVITNVGNGYNVHLGSFIAPVSGLYVFSAYLTAYGGVHASRFQFTRNGNQESQMYLHATESPYQSSTQMAVFQLNQGDDVQIRNVDADGHLHALYSSFSGFLVQQTYQNNPVVG